MLLLQDNKWFIADALFSCFILIKNFRIIKSIN